MHEVRKTVTILFADVVASTALGERLDPEALRGIVTRYFAEMAAVLERHGGTVEKFIGDEVMAVFGVPVVHEDDALRAVRAAAAMRERLETLNEELDGAWGARLEVRIGVNTGEVVAGDPSRGHGFVTGDAVNLAKRIEGAAEPGEILLGDATYRLVRHAVETTHVGPLSLKGKREAVEPQRLEGVDAASGAIARRFDAPLVGRRSELARLRAAYERALATRRPQLVTVLGPAGIGKSRLVRELLEGAASEALVLVGRCLPYGEGITFWPVREILPGESLEGTSEEIFWRVRRRLEERARERPLVVCLEDVHWAEPTFLDLVEYLAGWMRDVPVLLLCLARPDLLERRPDWSTSDAEPTTIALGPLTGEEAGELLELLEAPGGARGRIAEAAEGNPLFVEQMAAMAADEGEDVPVPPSIRALLAARLDRLDADETAVIERAAVIGREFALRGALELVPDELRGRAQSLLLGLVRKELVRPAEVGGEDGFRFRHALIRDAAYDALPKRLRAELHERHADALEAADAEDGLVGYHFEQGVELRRAVGRAGPETDRFARRGGEALGRAGLRALARDDVPAATKLLERAVRLLEDGHPAKLDLTRELSGTLWAVGQAWRAETLLAGVLRAAEAVGDARVVWSARLEQAARRTLTGDAPADELLAVAREAVTVFERLEDDTGLARAWRRIGAVEEGHGRFGAAEQAIERALVHARAAADGREEARCVDRLCSALLYGPAPVGAALERFEAILADARGNRLLEANVRISAGALTAMGGDLETARAHCGRARTLLHELGHRLPLANLAEAEGTVELLAGRPQSAEKALRAGCAILEEIGGGTALGYLLALLGEALLGQGREAESDAAVRRAEAAAASDDVTTQVLWRVVRARLAAAGGALAEGEVVARHAIALAETTDAVNLQADALLSLAVLLGAEGREAEQAEAAARAAERYAAKGNVLAARRVGLLLEPTIR